MAYLDQPDEELVYLALKNVFKDTNSQLSKRAIYKLIGNHKHQAAISQLLERYSIQVVHRSATVLLSEGLFASTIKASRRFPQLFDPLSERGVATLEAEATSGIVNGVNAQTQGGHYSHRKHEATTDFTNGTESNLNVTQTAPSNPNGFSILPPAAFDFSVQHMLLVRLQEILEYACFEFTKQSLPHILQTRQWIRPQFVELNRWIRELCGRQGVLSPYDHSNQTLGKAFDSVSRIRHVAVHHIPVTLKEIKRFMVDAMNLVQLLGIPTCIDAISELHSGTKRAADELEEIWQTQISKLETDRHHHAEQRAKITMLEKSALLKASQEVAIRQSLVSKKLLKTIHLSKFSLAETQSLGTESDAKLDNTTKPCDYMKGWEEVPYEKYTDKGTQVNISAAEGTSNSNELPGNLI